MSVPRYTGKPRTYRAVGVGRGDQVRTVLFTATRKYRFEAARAALGARVGAPIRVTTAR